MRSPATTLCSRQVGTLIEWSLRGRGSEAHDPKEAHGSSPKKVVPTCPNHAIPYHEVLWIHAGARAVEYGGQARVAVSSPGM